jgi:hypothetical protein
MLRQEIKRTESSVWYNGTGNNKAKLAAGGKFCADCNSPTHNVGVLANTARSAITGAQTAGTRMPTPPKGPMKKKRRKNKKMLQQRKLPKTRGKMKRKRKRKEQKQKLKLLKKQQKLFHLPHHPLRVKLTLQ